MEEKYLSTKDLAEKYNLQERAIRRWIKEGKLKAQKFGHQWRIKSTDWEEFADTRGGFESPDRPE